MAVTDLALQGLNHLTLTVRDLDRSLAFYQLLGFVPQLRWARGCYLQSAGTQPLWLALSLGEPKPAADYSHLAFSVAAADWPHWLQRLRDAGLLPARCWQPNQSEGESCYLLDPDGHQLELHVGSLHSRLTALRQQPYQDLQWLAARPQAAASALVLIDLQCGLFGEPPAQLPAVLQRLNQLIERAEAAVVPLIVVQHHAPGSLLTRFSDGWQLLPELRLPPSYHRIDKTTPDSFAGTALMALLTALGCPRLIVGGYASEFCIDTTVRSAAAHGLAVDLVADGHLTHDKPHASAAQIIAHENATLPAIRSFGVPIRALSAAEIGFD